MRTRQHWFGEIEGLKLSYKGSQSPLSSSEKAAVINWLKEQKYWDLSELECHLIEEYDVVFKARSSYYELLSAAKISWQKVQKKKPRKDPELVKKRNEEKWKVICEIFAPNAPEENPIEAVWLQLDLILD